MRALALSAAGLVPFLASAATLDLTGATGAAVASSGSYTDGAFGTVSFDAEILGTGSGSLTYEAGSGLGVDCRGYSLACRVDAVDQIDPGELLAISFSAPRFVTSVDISQLASRSIDLGRFSIVLEDAGVVVGSGFVVPFDADDATNGDLNVAINRWATSIRFVPILGSYDGFSLAGLSIDEFAVPAPSPGGGPSSPIPEPSSVLMMMIGGALVLFSIRKVAL